MRFYKENSDFIDLSLMTIIAEISMNYTIEKAMKLAKKKKIKILRALQVYMDDTCGIIKQNKRKTEHLELLECLNQIHPSLTHTRNRKERF